MALTLETLRNNIVTSLYGRRLGLQVDQTLVGVRDIKMEIEDITTASTGSALAAYGYSQILTSGSTQGPVQLNLPAPVPGTRKYVMMNTTSTGSHQLLSTPAGAQFRSASDGATAGVVNLRQGGGVCLHAITSTLWLVERFSTDILMSTSTG